MYLALAESLATGRGYTLYQAPLYAPSNIWPPVFPLGLSAVIRMFGLDLLALKIAMALLGLGTLVAVYLLFTRVRPTRWALTIVSLTALSPLYFSFSHQTMADLPILLCVVLALTGMDRWFRVGCPIGGGAFWLAVGAVTLGCMTKLQAVVLLAVPLVHYFANRKVRPPLSAKSVVAFCGAASIALAAWTVRGAWLERAGYHQSPQIYYVSSAAAPDAGTGSGVTVQINDMFGRSASAIAKTVVENARWRLLPNLAEEVAPPLSLTPWRSGAVPGWAILLLSMTVLLPVAIGWVVQCRKREILISTFYALHLLTILAAPYFANPRYLVCLIPFTFFYFLVGMEALSAKRWVVRASSVVLLVLGATALVAHIENAREQPTRRRRRPPSSTPHRGPGARSSRRR